MEKRNKFKISQNDIHVHYDETRWEMKFDIEMF